MSTELATVHSEVNNKVEMTRFFGGERGVCVQLTQSSFRSEVMFESVQLTKDQAAKMARELKLFAES